VVIPTIAGFGVASPPPVDQDALWRDHFAHRPGPAGGPGIWAASGIATRHAVVDPRVEDLAPATTGARMARYAALAPPLAIAATADALTAAGVEPAAVGMLATVSCTGYVAPGVDVEVAAALRMSPSLRRLHVGHVGCHAALPTLVTVADATAVHGWPSVVTCVELSSLHVQPPCEDVGDLVAHALFADAAAAVVVAPGGPGLAVVDLEACTDTSERAAMTWEIGDHGFRLGLSVRVPAVLARHVGPTVGALLGRHGLVVSDVVGWAVHPGGPRILDACADRLGLDDADLAASRAVLRGHGNCSSGTVLVVLDELVRTHPLADGDPVVALAFGPGLTIYAALFRAVGPLTPTSTCR
jgi:alkylresorcinol/alkylpyrone synthase